MRLLQLVKDRKDDLPDNDAEFGRAILQFVEELAVTFHLRSRGLLIFFRLR